MRIRNKTQRWSRGQVTVPGFWSYMVFRKQAERKGSG